MEHQPAAGISLQGNIGDIELNTIFQFFDYAALSGELRVEGRNNSALFFFQRGMLVFGTLQTNRKRLGLLLLESGLVSREKLIDALRFHALEGRRTRLGDILVQRGHLTAADLGEVLKAQAKEAFFETLAWKQGMFFFSVDRSPGKEEVLFNERIDHLLLEGIVRMDDAASDSGES